MVSVAGILSSLRKARKRTVSETLEELDISIKNLEEHKSRSISSASKIGFHLIFYASLIYASGLILCYCLMRPSELYSIVVFVSLAIAYPLLVWFFKYTINIYYLGSAERADHKLKDLRKQMEKELLRVMDTETYNTVQQLLKRFDPQGQVQKKYSSYELVQHRKSENENVLRNRRVNELANAQNKQTLATANSNRQPPPSELPSTVKGTPQVPGIASALPKVLVRHRPILPRERSLFDKLIDAMIGDGPDRRYALICQRCAAHNGMALAEEFEFLAFRCCYCEHLNPAHRVRRNSLVPKLDMLPSPGAESQGTPLSLKGRRVYSSSVSNLSATGIRNAASKEDIRRTLQPVSEHSGASLSRSEEKIASPEEKVEDVNKFLSSDESPFEE